MPCCDSADPQGSFRAGLGAPVGKAALPSNQQHWRTDLKFWVCSQLPLHFSQGACLKSYQSYFSTTSTVALWAQEDGKISIWVLCKFVIFNHKSKISDYVSKSSPKFCRNWCFQPYTAFILQVSVSLKCLKRYSSAFQF